MITKSIESTIRPKKTKNKFDVNSMVDNNKITNQKSFAKIKIQAKMAKSKNLIKFENQDFSFNLKNINIRSNFFIFKGRLVFIKLR